MTVLKKDDILCQEGGRDMVINGESFGEMLSGDSTRLIDELDLDIMEYGGHLMVDAIVRKINNTYYFIDYDFAPIKMKLKKNEKAVRMTATALMIILQRQNLTL